jgi:hypothetical protein
MGVNKLTYNLLAKDRSSLFSSYSELYLNNEIAAGK